MSRKALSEALERYAHQPWSTPEEQESLGRILFLLKSVPDCFRRECVLGHVTGSGWLLDPTEKYVALTHHRKLGLWLQFGGHADGDEDIWRVAEREVMEESGVDSLSFVSREIFDVDIHAIPANSLCPAHFHYDIRFCFKASDTTLRISEESNSLAWIRREEVSLHNNERSVVRMVEKWKPESNV